MKNQTTEKELWRLIRWSPVTATPALGGWAISAILGVPGWVMIALTAAGAGFGLWLLRIMIRATARRIEDGPYRQGFVDGSVYDGIVNG